MHTKAEIIDINKSFIHSQYSIISGSTDGTNKKLSCRRETARRFVSLNMSPSH